MINFYVQIYILAKINALINRYVQANEISEHITFKRRLIVIVHFLYIPFTNLDFCYEIIHKRNFANLIKELLPSKMASPNSTPTRFSHQHQKKIMFLQLSHATKIPCSCFGQVVAHMELHATIYIVWLYNLYKMVIHFYIYNQLHL